jgi:hypothetical protein
MIQDVLRDIGGVGVYGVISVSLFFLFFTGMLVWAFRLKAPYLNPGRQIALNEQGRVSP